MGASEIFLSKPIQHNGRMRHQSHINSYIHPALTGGIGTHSLRRFYEQHFLRALPPTMRLRLIYRAIGAGRIVDELYTSFDHTQEIPWMLPGVPGTNRKVEIILVNIVGCKAGEFVQ